MMVLSVDVDLKRYVAEELSVYVDPWDLIHKLEKIYGDALRTGEWSVVNRSREEKISFHIRCNKLVNRLELCEILNKLAWAEMQEDERTLASYADLRIYRQHGQLRLTDLAYGFDKGLPLV